MRPLPFSLAMLLLAPFAFAHDPVGTPKAYCEGPMEWAQHDYAGASTGVLLLAARDGSSDDCDGDGWPAEGDGHSEHAVGGAWFLAESGDGVTFGSVACYGQEAHHPSFGPFSVVDALLGPDAAFVVTADTTRSPDPFTGVDCGDFLADVRASCVGTCAVTFPPGTDGAYAVHVTVGTRGHLSTESIREDVFGIPGAASVTLHYTHRTRSLDVVPSPGWVCGQPVGDPHDEVVVSCAPTLISAPVYCQNPAVVAQRLDGGSVWARTQCMGMEPTCVGTSLPCQDVVWGDEQLTRSLVCRASLFPNEGSLADDWTVECYNDP